MVLLMATWSKKILVLGWAPPDKEDVVEHGVVDGDLVQEDLSTWMGTTCPTSTSQSVLHTHSRHRSLFIFSSWVHQISRCGWCVVDADILNSFEFLFSIFPLSFCNQLPFCSFFPFSFPQTSPGEPSPCGPHSTCEPLPNQRLTCGCQHGFVPAKVRKIFWEGQYREKFRRTAPQDVWEVARAMMSVPPVLCAGSPRSKHHNHHHQALLVIITSFFVTNLFWSKWWDPSIMTFLYSNSETFEMEFSENWEKCQYTEMSCLQHHDNRCG